MSKMIRQAEIFDTSGDRCSKTGKGAVFVGKEECRTALAGLKRLEAGDSARFLVDWSDGDGELLGSFGIDEAGFEALIGEPPESPEVYASFDEAFWDQARSARAKGAGQ